MDKNRPGACLISRKLERNNFFFIGIYQEIEAIGIG